MSNRSNKINVSEARAAMDKFKMETAAEVGVNLKEGYNGHLTSREAGSVGGQIHVPYELRIARWQTGQHRDIRLL